MVELKAKTPYIVCNSFTTAYIGERRTELKQNGEKGEWLSQCVSSD